MTEVILSIVILGLLIYIAVSQYITGKEREKLLKMFMAKDLREVTDNEALEKIPKKEPFIKPPDLASMDEVAEDEVLFDKHMQAMKAAAKEELKKEVEV
jgi:hypothetical protein